MKKGRKDKTMTVKEKNELLKYANALKNVDRLFYALSDGSKRLLKDNFDFSKLDNHMTNCYIYADDIEDIINENAV